MSGPKALILLTIGIISLRSRCDLFPKSLLKKLVNDIVIFVFYIIINKIIFAVQL